MSKQTEQADADRAYGEFVRRAWDPHLRVARLLTGDPHRAEELLQDCLVKLYARWHRMAWQQTPDAYLRSMLANGNVSWWRRRRREHLVADSPEQADPRAAPAEPYEELSRALRTLPRRQRAIVVLRHYRLGPRSPAGSGHRRTRGRGLGTRSHRRHQLPVHPYRTSVERSGVRLPGRC